MWKLSNGFLKKYFMFIIFISFLIAFHYTFDIKNFFSCIYNLLKEYLKKIMQIIKEYFKPENESEDLIKNEESKETNDINKNINQYYNLKNNCKYIELKDINKNKENKEINDKNKNLSKKEDINKMLKVNDKKDEFINNSEDVEKEIKCINFDNDIIFAFTFLGRFLITIYSFHGIFFIYNFIFQNLALLAIILYSFDKIILRLLAVVVYISLAALTSNVLVIPIFDFLSFPFLRFKNPLSHLETFNYINERKKFNSKDIKEKNNTFINICFIFISLIYIIGFILALFTSISSIKNFMVFIILSLIYIYYLTIYFSYILISIYIIKCQIFSNFNQHILPDLNLLSYSINPIYNDNYEENENNEIKNNFFDIRNWIRMFLFVILIIAFILISLKYQKRLLLSIIHFFLFFRSLLYQ